MTPEQKKIKAYVNAIERELRFTTEMKARINSDIGTEIHLLLEQGKTVDEVIQEIGTPEEVAERFHEELKEYIIEKRSPLAWLFLILTAASIVYGVVRIGTSWVSFLYCLGLCMSCFAAYVLAQYTKHMTLRKSKQAVFLAAAAFVIFIVVFWIDAITSNIPGGILQWTLTLGGFSGRRSRITMEPAAVLSVIVLIVSIRKYKKNRAVSD